MSIHANMNDPIIDPELLRIPVVNENPYAVPNAPRKDVIYQVALPDGSRLRKYVSVTEVYGDKGLARCRVVRSYDEHGKICSEDEGQELSVDLDRLVQPDAFPELARSAQQWIEASGQPLSEIAAYVSRLIDDHLQTVTAYDMADDVDRTLKGIKTLLKGKIGGFFLTLLMAFIGKKLNNALKAKVNEPTPKEAFNTRLSQTHSLYSRKGPEAQREEDVKTKKIETLTERMKRLEEEQRKAKEGDKPEPKSKPAPKTIPPGAKMNKPVKK